MLTRPKVSSIVASQLPEFVRDEYQTFVDFLKAYYEFLETTQQDPVTLRDLDTTLDSFITYFKDELAQKLPYSTVDERFLLTRIKDMYLAKGSEASFRLLFRILFNKEIEIDYPSTQMLRASDGKWNQDVAVFVKVLVGNPQDIVGKLVDVVTQSKIIRVLVDRRQYVEVEIDRAIRISDNVYEFILDRRFFGNISVGDTLRYLDANNNLIFNGVILPTTTTLTIEKPGTGFKVGDLYTINNFNGYGTIMKVAAVDSNGGIAQGQFIKFGTGYTTDFTSSITSQKGQDTSGTAGTIISRVDTFLPPANKAVSLSISEGMSGFAESGSINTADYNLAVTTTISGTLSVTNNSTAVTGVGTLFTTQVAYGDYLNLGGVSCKVASVNSDTSITLDTNYTGTTSTSLTQVTSLKPAAIDGTFAGNTIREFGISSVNSLATTTDPAIIKVGLGALAKYPGYYVNNDGFLDDAIFIQDSRYYQAFSYVIKIDQSLNTYKTIVKNLVHPAGMAVFGEYDLRNELSINTTIESMIKILSVTVNDKAVTTDTSLYNGVSLVERKDVSKLVDDTALNNDLTQDNQDVIPTDSNTRAFGKTVDGTSVNWDGSIDPQTAGTSGDTTANSIVKMLNSVLYDHYLNNGTTLDNDTVSETDNISAKDFGKLLNASTTNYDGSVDNNSSQPVENSYLYADRTTRLGISKFDVTKSLTDPVTPSDTNAASPTDLNRTIPAFTFVKDTIAETYSGATDSGGNMLVNPYAEAGWFLNDNGTYVGSPITFTG